MPSIHVLEADYDDPVHRAAIVDVIDSYASDPIGGGEPLSAAVRDSLVPKLQNHPTARILLAFADATPVGPPSVSLGCRRFAPNRSSISTTSRWSLTGAERAWVGRC